MNGSDSKVRKVVIEPNLCGAGMNAIAEFQRGLFGKRADNNLGRLCKAVGKNV